MAKSLPTKHTFSVSMQHWLKQSKNRKTEQKELETIKSVLLSVILLELVLNLPMLIHEPSSTFVSCDE